VREAKVKAAREGTTLTALVIDALARSLEPRAEGTAPIDDELRESAQWYEDNRDDLLQRYPNEYVAIVDRQVLDHDHDFESLATRTFARLGARSIFMPRVTETGERARVRSPRRRAS
jgi:hypothetical protein